MTKIISRLAPTPSGYLHLGNGVNLVLAYLLTRSQNGVLHLRIDDIDVERVRQRYIEIVFYSLDYLGITWDKGPSSVEDYYKNYAYEKRKYLYYEALCDFKDFLYPCECSRKEIANISNNGLYPQTCRNKNLDYDSKKHTLRLKSEPFMKVFLDKEINVYKSIGDVVLWRKGNLPSFVFASLVDDLTMNTNLFVRGEDLLTTSALQIVLSSLIGQDISETKFVHHKLVYDKNGQKLSKSTKAQSLLNPQARLKIYEEVANILNLPKDMAENIKNLQKALSFGYQDNKCKITL